MLDIHAVAAFDPFDLFLAAIADADVLYPITRADDDTIAGGAHGDTGPHGGEGLNADIGAAQTMECRAITGEIDGAITMLDEILDEAGRAQRAIERPGEGDGMGAERCEIEQGKHT